MPSSFFSMKILFMKDFISKAQKMIPDVDASMLETGPSGVRAQAISREGKLQMDYGYVVLQLAF